MTHKLLIVDDHPETLDIITRVLRQQGYEVLATNSGLHGLALAEAERPDLILLDGMMPDIDGWEVCRRIRNNPQIAHTAVIMFSAVNVAEQKLAGFNAGADDYLTKPTEPLELLERVGALLENVPPRNPSTATAVATPPPTPQKQTPDHTVSLSNSHELVVLLGARGGSGTTSLALNLAFVLANGERRVTLVDLDTNQGHIGIYLNQKVSNGLNQLANQPRIVGKDVLSSLRPYNDHLKLLLSENNLQNKAKVPTGEQSATILDLLSGPSMATVVDGGRGITAVNRTAVEQADHIILCIPPERISLAATKQFLPQLQDVLFPHTQLWLVLLDFSGNATVPQKAIEAFLGHAITAVVAVNPQELRRSVNKGVPLAELFPEAKASVTIHQLARKLVRE